MVHGKGKQGSAQSYLFESEADKNSCPGGSRATVAADSEKWSHMKLKDLELNLDDVTKPNTPESSTDDTDTLQKPDEITKIGEPAK